MKTELVAKWIVVNGRLEMQWSLKDDNKVMPMSQFVPESAKAA